MEVEEVVPLQAGMGPRALAPGCPHALPSPRTPQQAGAVPQCRYTQAPAGCCDPRVLPTLRPMPLILSRSQGSTHLAILTSPASPTGHPAGILIFPKISRGAGASAHRQQVTNKIFPLFRAPGMGLSLKMQSSAVPTSTAHPSLHQPLGAEHPTS